MKRLIQLDVNSTIPDNAKFITTKRVLDYDNRYEQLVSSGWFTYQTQMVTPCKTVLIYEVEE